MLQNYFKIALRNLRRQAGYAFINSEDPMGQVITFQDQLDLTVTGVIQDLPAKWNPFCFCSRAYPFG